MIVACPDVGFARIVLVEQLDEVIRVFSFPGI
jgi:hypothetical protein